VTAVPSIETNSSIKYLPGTKKVKSKPNEKYSYSNLGYVLLGQLIEKVSGVSFERYVNENIVIT